MIEVLGFFAILLGIMILVSKKSDWTGRSRDD